MRMFKAGNGASFGEVGPGVFRAGNTLCMWHFDRYIAIQLFVSSQIDETKPASPQHLLDPVASDSFWHF